MLELHRGAPWLAPYAVPTRWSKRIDAAEDHAVGADRLAERDGALVHPDGPAQLRRRQRVDDGEIGHEAERRLVGEARGRPAR